MERALVASRGFAKVVAACGIRPGRLDLSTSVVKLLGAIFEDHPHAFSPSLQAAAVSAGAAELAAALLHCRTGGVAPTAAQGAAAAEAAALAAPGSEPSAPARLPRSSSMQTGAPPFAAASRTARISSVVEPPPARNDSGAAAPSASSTGPPGIRSTTSAVATDSNPLGPFAGRPQAGPPTADSGGPAAAPFGRGTSGTGSGSDTGPPPAAEEFLTPAEADGMEMQARVCCGSLFFLTLTTEQSPLQISSHSPRRPDAVRPRPPACAQAVAALARVAGSATDTARAALKTVVGAGAVERIAEIALANLGTPDERLRLQEDALAALYALTVTQALTEAKARARTNHAFLALLHAVSQAEAAEAAQPAGKKQAAARADAEQVRGMVAEMSRAVWHRSVLPGVEGQAAQGAAGGGVASPAAAGAAATGGAPFPPGRGPSSLQALNVRKPGRLSMGDVVVAATAAAGAGQLPDTPLSPFSPTKGTPKRRFSWAQGRKLSSSALTGVALDSPESEGGSSAADPAAGQQATPAKITASQRWAVAAKAARAASGGGDGGGEGSAGAEPAEAAAADEDGGSSASWVPPARRASLGELPVHRLTALTVWEEDPDEEDGARPAVGAGSMHQLRRRASAPMVARATGSSASYHAGYTVDRLLGDPATAQQSVARRGLLVNSLHVPAPALPAADSGGHAAAGKPSAANRFAAALSGVFSRGSKASKATAVAAAGAPPPVITSHPPPAKTSSDSVSPRRGGKGRVSLSAAAAAAAGGGAAAAQFKSVLQAMLAEDAALSSPRFTSAASLPPGLPSPVSPQGPPPDQAGGPRRRRSSLPTTTGVGPLPPADSALPAGSAAPFKARIEKRTSAPVLDTANPGAAAATTAGAAAAEAAAGLATSSSSRPAAAPAPPGAGAAAAPRKYRSSMTLAAPGGGPSGAKVVAGGAASPPRHPPAGGAGGGEMADAAATAVCGTEAGGTTDEKDPLMNWALSAC